GAVDALHDFRTHFFKHVGGQIGHAHLHVFKYAKLVSLLGGVDRIGAVVQVDHDVGTTVGNVQHVGAVVGCAQRVDLCVVDGGPALLFGEGTHVIMNGVTVVVVGHQVDDFQVLAVVFGHDWRNGLGCRVGMVTQAEAIAAAVFSGGITGAADDGEIQGLGALARVLQGNGHGTADAAGNHHGVVFFQKPLGSLNGTVRLGFCVTNGQLEFLAQNTLLGVRADQLDAFITVVDHLGGQFKAA